MQGGFGTGCPGGFCAIGLWSWRHISGGFCPVGFRIGRYIWGDFALIQSMDLC